jgi:hypothetical protein
MTYITKYKICGLEHTWKTDNQIVSDGNELHFSTEEKHIYKILLEMLEWFQKVAAKNDIKWFAMSGTLLGACRNNGIIPHDNDVDVGVPISEYWKLKKLCGKNKCGKYDIQQTESCGFRVYQTNDSKFPFVDIFIMAEEEKEKGVFKYAGPFYKDKPFFYLSRTFEKEWIYASDLDKLETAKFEHLTIPIPANSDKWLKRVYGDDCYTRYVPDTRSPLLHQLVDLLPLYEMEQSFAFFIRDILQLDKSNNPESHIAFLVHQLILCLPVQLSQTPQAIVNKIVKTITKHIIAKTQDE